jgi:peptidoglycan-associated lipoprotein
MNESSSRVVALSLAAWLGVFAFACNKNDAPAKTPENATGGPPPASSAPLAGPSDLGAKGPGLQSTTLNVSEDIARLCQLPAPKQQANFSYDSSSIADDDKDLLTAIAKCLSDGPLKGRKLSLVGRADPRGENEYNMSLGGARADSVRRYLGSLGVEENRLSTTSRGEIDATGTDEAGWARDRRVDITLAN